MVLLKRKSGDRTLTSGKNVSLHDSGQTLAHQSLMDTESDFNFGMILRTGLRTFSDAAWSGSQDPVTTLGTISGGNCYQSAYITDLETDLRLTQLSAVLAS